MAEEETVSLPVLAEARLTQEQVEVLTIKSLLAENEELSAAVDNKQVRVLTKWQTSKWSDPDALVHITFAEVSDGDGSDTDSILHTETEAEESWEDDGTDDEADE